MTSCDPLFARCARPIQVDAGHYGVFAVAYHVACWEAFVEVKVIGTVPDRERSEGTVASRWEASA